MGSICKMVIFVIKFLQLLWNEQHSDCFHSSILKLWGYRCLTYSIFYFRIFMSKINLLIEYYLIKIMVPIYLI